MNIDEQIRFARSRSFFTDLGGRYDAIRLSGKDTAGFLQNLTTADVIRLEAGEWCDNAILDKRSAIIALYKTYRLEDSWLIVCEAPLAGVIREHLECHHFAEETTVGEAGRFALCALEGPESPEVLSRIAGGCSFDGDPVERAASVTVGEDEWLTLPFSRTGDPGYLLAAERPCGPTLAGALRAEGGLGDGAFGIGAEAEDVLRLEAGIARHGVDYDGTTLILELARSGEFVGREKGCYPGQEIVARIESRGNVKKKLVGLMFRPGEPVEPGASLRLDGEDVGRITSACDSPTVRSGIALAELKRPHYDDIGMERSFDVGGHPVAGRVVHLPFHVSKAVRERFEREYGLGMEAYHADRYDRAIAHFREAARLRPGDPDPFEALGMALERSGDMDGAIRWNRRFARRHPTSFMARTNLSRLYMLKGMKAEAEEEMGRSTVIQMRLHAKSAKAKKELEEKRREAETAERERRLSIFRQVLEMDPEDEVANFGMGNYYNEAGEYDLAVEHLRLVVKINPEYSAAFALLGDALAESGRADEANDVLRRGIAVAEERGDLMPLRRMQERLKHVV